jgi:Tol biopolymer transport system component
MRFWLSRKQALQGSAAAAIVAGGLGLTRYVGHTQIMMLREPRETHLANVRQLTFGGQNAEAYFSPDGKRLTFQSTRDGHSCDQQFIMNLDGTGVQRISNGKGRTTCGWWMKDGKRILFASTHGASDDCPPRPDFSQGYVWPIYPTYAIYSVKPDGSDLRLLFPQNLKAGEEPGYNAEAVVSPDGKKIVFCSTRGGDLDIWVMDSNGKNARQLTYTLGYDGGPWWSPDGKQICFRAYHPETPEEIEQYKSYLKRNLFKPTTLDIYVMNADGSNLRRVTNDKSRGISNFAPSWTPDGKGLVFSSNRDDSKRLNFEIYKINLDGTGLERITYGGRFDGFPMFSPDGKKFVWASNRNGKAPRETNVFIADWVP